MGKYLDPGERIEDRIDKIISINIEAVYIAASNLYIYIRENRRPNGRIKSS